MRMPLPSAWNLEYVVLRAGNGIHKPTIVDESYSSHDKERNNALHFVMCLTLTSKSTVVLCICPQLAVTMMPLPSGT